MNEGFGIYSIDILLDSSVKSLTKVAAMCISGVIENGIVLALNENPKIKIYKNKIEFGKCYNPELQGLAGNIMTNYYLEYGNIVYYFNSGYKHSFWSKQLDYQGVMPPTQPDNEYIFNLIYPRFA